MIAGTTNVMNVKVENDSKIVEKFPLFDTSVKVTWYQWGKKLMASGKEQLQKVQKSGKADVLYNDLTLMVPSFLQHFFIK